jgi:hypothetical protein
MSAHKVKRVKLGTFLLVSGFVWTIGCAGTSRRHGVSPEDEHAISLVVLEDLACSKTSPVPSSSYRPQPAPGVTPVLVVNSKYAEPDGFTLENATKLNLQGAVAALKAANGSGDVSISGAQFACGVQAVFDTKWNREWQTFREAFPGGLAWVTLSRVGLNSDRSTAFIYSHVQWGPLQGESDIWSLSRGAHREWKVVRMYSVASS